MKVLFINSVVDFGSTGKIVRELSNALNQEGHETLIIYGRKTTDNALNTFSVVDQIQSYYHVFMSRFFGRSGLHSTKATKKIIRKIQEYQPDVIHLHNLHGYYLNVPMLMQALKTSYTGKIIITLHDCWLFSGSSAYFDYNGCKVWDDGCVECNSTRDYPQALLFPRQRKNFQWKKQAFSGLSNTYIITPSKWLKDLVKTTYLKDYPVEVVPNGINIDTFKEILDPDIASKYQGKKICLGVSNIWERRKGLDDFLAVAKSLSDDYIMVLVGLTEKQIQQLPSNIIGITRTSNVDELVKLYSNAHVYLNLTYEDNYPTTNLEALACGTPVIAYQTGGNTECAQFPNLVAIQQGAIQDVVDAIYATNLRVTIDRKDLGTKEFLSRMMKFYQD